MSAPEFQMLKHSYQTVIEECDTWLTPLEGDLPDGLIGTLYRNGPGRMERGGLPYGHPFDGDGMVQRFEFSARGVHYRNRFVRSEGFVAEERADRILYRNFGTNIPGGVRKNFLRMQFKNAANTSVRFHAGRLLALWEGGLPHRLDPVSLETLGLEDFGGAFRTRGPMRLLMGPELPFSAHPRVDLETGAMHNFGQIMSREPMLNLYEVSSTGVAQPIRQVAHGLFGFIHDFVLTPRFYVFFICPMKYSFFKLLAGIEPPTGAGQFDQKLPTRILLVPRDGGKMLEFSTPPCFVFHFANGFEEGDDRVMVDAHVMDGYPQLKPGASLEKLVNSNIPSGKLYRYELNLKHGQAVRRRLIPTGCELPTVHPHLTGRPYRYLYAIASVRPEMGPIYTSICRVDVKTGEELIRTYDLQLPSEPVFVPRPGAEAEDDGWLLHTCYVEAVRRTEILVLDAKTLKTLFRARCPIQAPVGFHGEWVAA